VDSAIVSFTLRSELPDADLRKKAGTLAKAAFAQRRKQMPNTLSNLFGGRDNVREALVALGHPESERPERLTVEEWLSLAAAWDNRP
jgi:16S rRNA (adenine1518-N6/adenine1519-N6)-dimethyltransferase